MNTDPCLTAITDRIAARSVVSRAAYLARIGRASDERPARARIGCANQAHGFAAMSLGDKAALRAAQVPNLGIVTAYNDMLSAHQPYETYPALIRDVARAEGATAQVAGGVPAMCDGVTQGEGGMDLSLFSRDVIALSTAIALSHQTFDAAVYLGVCDKIVPGLVIGALSFGHLPAVFIPAGPMVSGLPNQKKAAVRQLYAEGRATREELLEAEAASYHGPGTCTFYGTANTNQMLVEIMGLHVPGAAFVNPGTKLREELTVAAIRRALAITAIGNDLTPLGEMLDERVWVNAVVALNATGGSTNHTMHLVAMAAAAGIALTWDDMRDLAAITPLLCRIYPNGRADVNHFSAAGGTGFVVRELLSAGLLHEDVRTIWGTGLSAYAAEPALDASGALTWRAPPDESGAPDVLRGVLEPFHAQGGMSVLDGNLGRAVMKTSSIKPDRHVIEGPARVFDDQEELQTAFREGTLTGDFIAVVRFQGPRANGMPELHKLMPPLGVLQDRGQRVALVTDGRMSGASGKVPAAIHVTPEAQVGGPLARLRDGDILRIDATAGTLTVLVPAEEFEARVPMPPVAEAETVGRDLFAAFRRTVSTADQGAGIFAVAA